MPFLMNLFGIFSYTGNHYFPFTDKHPHISFSKSCTILYNGENKGIPLIQTFVILQSPCHFGIRFFRETRPYGGEFCVQRPKFHTYRKPCHFDMPLLTRLQFILSTRLRSETPLIDIQEKTCQKEKNAIHYQIADQRKEMNFWIYRDFAGRM